MKKNIKRLKLSLLLFSIALVMVSCTKEGEEVIQQERFDVAALIASDETALIIEEIINIGEDVYTTDEIRMTSRASYTSDYLPDCVTITTIITATSKEKTINFGTGCELPNGNLLSGIINLTYQKDMELAMKTLNFSLENFTFNKVSVAGSANVERIRSNANGNPQADAVGTFEVQWPDGSRANFTGNRTREWIEGYGSGYWGDNVILISGKRTYTGKLGNVFTKETLIPLRREWSCRFVVSGVLEISRNNTTASLDFGDGSCDAVGMLSYPDGSSQEILLRRFENN